MFDKLHPVLLRIPLEDHVPMDAAFWFESGISTSLINQYPDVYWRMVFTYFESEFITQTWQHGFYTVAAFLDCHGLVPEEYRHVEEPEHRFRTQDRPRLRLLYQQFVAQDFWDNLEAQNPTRNAPARRQVFGPPANHPFSLPRMLESIWDPDTLSEPSPTDPNMIEVQYETLFGQLVDAISAFERGYLTPYRAPATPATDLVVFEPMQVIRSRQAYYLTLYQLFRNEVCQLCEMASQIEPQVQQWVELEMAHMEENLQRRAFVYRGLHSFFAQSGKFRVANNFERTRVVNDLLHHLKVSGVYSSSWMERRLEDGEWQDWWPEREPQLAPWEDAGAAQPVMLPSGGYPQVSEFLARMTIISPNVTNGQLTEFLVDSMVELAHVQERDWCADRMLGRDLFEQDAQAESPVDLRDTFDPNQVRSQIIWLCLIQFPLHLFRTHNGLNEPRGAPFD